MDRIILSICIPTYNRVKYLRELIPSLITELAVVNRDAMQVELVISDNAATDGTGEYLRGLSGRGLRVYRNSENIGASRNYLACIDHALGEYIWLFGDDELIVSGGIGGVLTLLTNVHPALLILQASGQDADGEKVVVYPDYGTCVHEEMKGNPAFALSHTLITANVFRKEVFDPKKALAMLYTEYSQMYGLMSGLKIGGRIAFMAGVFSVRAQRAPFERWPTALCVKQAGYLWRLAGWFDVPRLRSMAFRLALNLPVEVLSCMAHKFLPGRFRQT